MENLLTAEELAERLRLRPSTVKGWAKAGRIPAVRVGAKVIRFDFAQVREALERGQAQGVQHVR